MTGQEDAESTRQDHTGTATAGQQHPSTRRRTNRWRVGLIGAVALACFGLLFTNITLLVAAIIPLSYLLYDSLSKIPEGIQLHAERQFEPATPVPGELVTVKLTVTNATEATLTDVRLIDGVPDALRVLSGSPRAAVSLQAGEETTLSYTVLARRGEFDFADPVIRVRSLAGGSVVTTTVTADGNTTLTGANAVRDPFPSDSSLPRAGTLPTDSGGDGLEFYATRRYRTGDSMRRIDWRNYAKTGELVTVQYREERAVRTVIVLDARPVGHVTPAAGYPTGTALCSYAGERIHDALTRAGVITDVTAVGFEPGDINGLVGPDGLPWIDGEGPGGSRINPKLLFDAVTTEAEHSPQAVSTRPPAAAPSPPAADPNPYTDTAVMADGRGNASPAATQRIEFLLGRLPPNAQVVICTTLLDNWAVTLGRALSARGYPMVVVTPDVLQRDSPGQQLTAAVRQLRIRALEQLGVTVSWQPEQPVDYALRRSLPHLLTQP